MKITAKLMYGLPYSEISDKAKVIKLIKSGKLTSTCPYQTVKAHDMFVGIEIKDGAGWYLMDGRISKAAHEFFGLMKVDGILKAVPLEFY